jgi:hypothetical protein
MSILIASLIALVPFAVVIGLLALSTRREHARAARMARQTAVTEAIHRELGAVVAPVLESGSRRLQRLRIAVPFDRPALVARVLALSQQTLAGPGHRLEIVLVPQAGRRRR